MKTFEFKVLTAGYDHDANRRIENAQELEDHLNRLGAEGWDFKSTVIIKSDTLHVFKREIESETGKDVSVTDGKFNLDKAADVIGKKGKK